MSQNHAWPGRRGWECESQWREGLVSVGLEKDLEQRVEGVASSGFSQVSFKVLS